MENVKKSFFESKIKPALLYIGSIGAIFTTLAYLVIIFIMIFGFKVKSAEQALVFAVVNAVVGLIIMQLLKIQGIDFAKTEPKNQQVIQKYNTTRVKKRRTHSLKWFWIWSSIKDVIVKGVMIALTSAGLIYIVVVGSQDYLLLLLALANILMFICFGLLALVNAYDFFSEKYIPYIVEELEKIEEKQNEKKVNKVKKNEKPKRKTKKNVAVVKTKHNKQGNNCTCPDCRDGVLESSVGVSDTSNNSESVVLDSSNNCNSVLGRTIHTGSNTSDSINPVTEEAISKNEKEE